jgi:hypothetical protein
MEYARLETATLALPRGPIKSHLTELYAGARLDEADAFDEIYVKLFGFR